MAGPYPEEEEQRPPLAPSEQRQQEKEEEEGSDDHEGGILLYYAYRPLAGDGQREAVARWYEEEAAVGLVGRVRVALDGINATLGGSLRQLRRHIATVEAHPLLRPSAEPSSLLPQARDPIDFKLCLNKEGARNAQCRAEAGFDRLRISRCLEVVSLGPHAAAVLSRQGQQEGGEQEPARHVSPEEFHRLLEEAAAATTDNQGGSDGSSHQGKGVVLLDARNLYESRIGRFAAPDVPVLAPPVRQFSELPAWLDRNAEAGLKGKRIAMYCTGGVRCERLSQYIKAKGEGYQDVVQLKGGIQRYLEAFPGSAGFFRGKNFVFDERVAVGPREAPASSSSSSNTKATTTTIVGVCLGCAKPWDDYGARARCRQCRMLVLACDACLLGSRRGGELELVCERCAAGCDGGGGGGAASRRSRWKKKGMRERREQEPQVGKDRRRASRGVGEEEEERGGVEALAGLFAEAAGVGQ